MFLAIFAYFSLVLFITSSAIVDKLHFLPSPMIPLLLFAVPIAQLRVLVPVLARASLLVMERKMKSRKKKKGIRKKKTVRMAGGRSRELAFLSLSLTAHWLVAWNEQQSVCLFVCEDTFFSAHIIRRLLILQCACAIILVGSACRAAAAASTRALLICKLKLMDLCSPVASFSCC